MSYVKEKSKNQILEELNGTAQPNSSVHEQQKMGIIVRCTEDMQGSLGRLMESIDDNTEHVGFASKRIETSMGQMADKIEQSFKSFEASVSQNATSSQELAKKVYWLNVVLALATVAGVVIAILSL